MVCTCIMWCVVCVGEVKRFDKLPHHINNRISIASVQVLGAKLVTKLTTTRCAGSFSPATRKQTSESNGERSKRLKLGDCV